MAGPVVACTSADGLALVGPPVVGPAVVESSIDGPAVAGLSVDPAATGRVVRPQFPEDISFPFSSP